MQDDARSYIDFVDKEFEAIVIDVTNLKRLLTCQQEDLSRYFAGTPGQLAALTRHLDKYNAYYRDYIECYERESGHQAR